MNPAPVLALLGVVVVTWNATFLLTAQTGVLVPIGCVAGVLGGIGLLRGRAAGLSCGAGR